MARILDTVAAHFAVPDELTLAVAMGHIPGYHIVDKFGWNPDVDTAADEDVWSNGGVYTGQPVGFVPETVDVFSDDAADTTAGTGARTVEITGLLTSTATVYTTETLTLNGVTPVTSTNTWYRVNRARVLTAGSGGENAGNITIQATTTTSNVFAFIGVGFNQSQVAAWTVPIGHTLYIKTVEVGISRANGSPGSALLTLRQRDPGEVYQAKVNLEIQVGAGSPMDFDFAKVVPAGSDIKIRAQDISDNNTKVTGRIFGYYISDHYST